MTKINNATPRELFVELKQAARSPHDPSKIDKIFALVTKVLTDNNFLSGVDKSVKNRQNVSQFIRDLDSLYSPETNAIYYLAERLLTK